MSQNLEVVKGFQNVSKNVTKSSFRMISKNVSDQLFPEGSIYSLQNTASGPAYGKITRITNPDTDTTSYTLTDAWREDMIIGYADLEHYCPDIYPLAVYEDSYYVVFSIPFHAEWYDMGQYYKKDFYLNYFLHDIRRTYSYHATNPTDYLTSRFTVELNDTPNPYNSSIHVEYFAGTGLITWNMDGSCKMAEGRNTYIVFSPYLHFGLPSVDPDNQLDSMMIGVSVLNCSMVTYYSFPYNWTINRTGTTGGRGYFSTPSWTSWIDLATMSINNHNMVPTSFGEFMEFGGPISEEEPYNGDYDPSSDTVGIPTKPSIGVTNVGFINVYKTDSGALTGLGAELFPPLTYSQMAPTSTGLSIPDAIIDSFNNLATWLANIPSFFEQINANAYINYIIDCHVIPVAPEVGASEHIMVGSKTLSKSGYMVTSDYVDFDCGTISLEEFYGNFADYLLSSCKLYLPFVGFVPAKPEWFTRTSLNVTYRFNVIDGSFMAFVRSTGAHVNNGNEGPTLIGQYSGNACMHLPITGVTYSNMVAGLIGAGAGMAAGAASGNLVGVATSAIAAAGAHGDIAQSNSYNSSASFLGCRRPYLLIERPVSNYSANYQHELGIPSNIYMRLGNVLGFVQMENVHLEGIDLTEGEKEELRSLLAGGVIN